MLLNSVNTNMGAMVALESLNTTQTSLQATEKQISTGYRVADATDDGAAYAVAQGIRSNVAGLTAATQQLQSSAGLVNTTLTSLGSISSTMSHVQTVLSELGNGSISASQRTAYNTDLQSYLKQIKTALAGASYQGKNLIDNLTTNSGLDSTTSNTSVSIVQDERGTQLSVKTQTVGTSVFNAISTIYTTLSGAAGATAAAAAANAITATGTFTKALTAVGNALNYYGNTSDFIDNQVTFNNNRINAMNTGLGALVDANLSQEAAQLQALQTRQQLGTQALSLANQAPNSLLSLFR